MSKKIFITICSVFQIVGFVLVLLYKQDIYIPYLNWLFVIAGAAGMIKLVLTINSPHRYYHFLAGLAGMGFIIIGLTGVLKY